MRSELIGGVSGALASACIFEAVRVLAGSSYIEQARARLAVLTGVTPAGQLESRVTDMVAALACSAAALILIGFEQSLVALAAVPASAIALRRVRAGRTLKQLEESLPSQLRALADGLLVGRTLEQAAADCGRSGTAAGDLLARFAAVRLAGAELGAALQVFARAGNADVWAPVAVAISLNRRCGGDLPAALRGVSDSLQAITDARSDADAAIAQARFTARLVLGLAMVALAGLCVVSPGIVSTVASTPVTAAMALVAVGLQLSCILGIRRIAAHACR